MIRQDRGRKITRFGLELAKFSLTFLRITKEKFIKIVLGK